MLRVSFDIGGVLSKYPAIFRPMIVALTTGGAEVHILTDMHEHPKVLAMLAMNGLGPDLIPPARVHCADYAGLGERCKAAVIAREGIDLHIDDFPGYCAGGGLQALIWPNPDEPYFHDDWKTDGSEGDFGRRRRKVAP